YCGHCGKGPFPTPAGVQHHIRRVAACRAKYVQDFDAFAKNLWEPSTPERQASPTEAASNKASRDEPVEPQTFCPPPLEEPVDHIPIGPSAAQPSGNTTPDAHHQRRVTIEEVEDEGDPYLGTARHIQACPSEWLAGAVFGEGKTKYEKVSEASDNVFGPFADEEEWDLARWLVSSVGQTKADEFLKMPIARERLDLSFLNKDHLMKKIDSLPTQTPGWFRETITAHGDLMDAHGNASTEVLELWRRDPVACVRELIGN
ncbi:hypothetical protein BC835DRAFT_1219498, partial [Cytidiella melzeri]